MYKIVVIFKYSNRPHFYVQVNAIINYNVLFECYPPGNTRSSTYTCTVAVFTIRRKKRRRNVSRTKPVQLPTVVITHTTFIHFMYILSIKDFQSTYAERLSFADSFSNQHKYPMQLYDIYNCMHTAVCAYSCTCVSNLLLVRSEYIRTHL